MHAVLEPTIPATPNKEDIELSVVMPCLNEALTVGHCVDKAIAAMRDLSIHGEVIVADNGSTDGSQEIARSHGARVVPVAQRGYGSALQGGIAASRGRYVVMGDADDSYDFGQLRPFLEKLRQGYELVMGNRFRGGIRPGAMPWSHRYIGNPVLTGILNLLYRSPIGDAHSGLRAFRKDAYLQLGLTTPGMEFASEMVVKACLKRQRITEVPIVLHPDGRDRPPHLRSFRDGWRHLRFLIQHWPVWGYLAPSAIAKRLRSVPSLFTLLVMVLLAVNYFAPFADLDFSWQIRTGAQIVHTGQLRPTESFSYTIAGRKVPEFEWLYEVGVWGIYSALGLGGLKLLRVLLVFTPLLLVALRLRREGVRWYGIAASILLAVFALSPYWNLRPLFCTTIGLLLVSGALHDHCLGRRRLGWWLPLLMLFWGNLHPGVIAGQGLLLGAIVCEWANRVLRINPPLARPALRRLTLIGGLGLLASFVCPSPIDRLLYPFRGELAHPIQHIFVEMRPAYSFLLMPPFALFLVYLLFVFVAATVILRFRKYRLWEIALLVGVTSLANLAVRSVQDWLLIMLAVGVPHLSALVREWHLSTLRDQKLSRVVGLQTSFKPPAAVGAFLRVIRLFAKPFYGRPIRFQWIWAGVVVVFLAGISFIPPLARNVPIQNSKDWPVQALDEIEKRGLEGRFFAIPDFGSYIGWRLGDRAKVYVDTRGFFFPSELIEDSYYIPQMGDQWESRMERVMASGTDYFLLETDGPRGALWQALSRHIATPLYADEKAVLLSRQQVTDALPRIRDGQHLAHAAQ
jgi:glycosyltransferase involved in cell wall biosynthesis